MTITIELPDNVRADKRNLKTALAVQLYELGILDSGDAADLAGLSRRTFIEKMPKYGYSIFDLSTQEVQEDLDNARSW
jgi:predicted HTH domain antitoxin